MKHLRIFLVMIFLTGIVYPFFITGIAKLIAPSPTVLFKGKIIGSFLIAQNFKDPQYFWPRPSFKNFNPLKSGGSNFSLTKRLLNKVVEERKTDWLKEDSNQKVPNELLFASGSGLDPHISQDAAIFQIKRIAKARHLSNEKEAIIYRIVNENTITSLFSDTSYVNVLNLNLSLDNL